ncbi:DUF2442 domain-containing protein [Parasediminibacterium sp. JCM 36343]|uniref:DUF2442 domain-containing protein n=1 Tax=Parasediminibacterium sp. JCM 36343 TaxID=3374279 RepID=UPI003979A30B
MRITKVWFNDENIYFRTDVGHTIGNPLAWFPSLLNATPEQRHRFRIGHYGVHWEELNEDLSLEGRLFRIGINIFVQF